MSAMPDAATLPDLSAAYALAPGAVEAYRRDGHVQVKGLCSAAEIAAYRPVIVGTVDRYKSSLPPLAERDTYGKAFIQIMNLWKMDPEVAKFTLARRFAKVAAELMGVSGVRLYHDQALFKEAGGGHTPWHQDQFYWPLDTDRTITMWMPLIDVGTEMGTMKFASRSQRDGYIGKLAISDKSEAIFKQYVSDKGYPVVESGAMRAGDATWHSGWTLHAAPGNATARVREVMTIIYFADGTKVGAVDHPNRQADLDGWLPGLKTGDLAASPLNPLLYPA